MDDKYRRPLTEAEVTAARQWCGTFARILVDCPFDLERLIQECDRYDSIAPIMDPTGWMKNHKGVSDHKQLFEALQTCRLKIVGLLGGQERIEELRNKAAEEILERTRQDARSRQR